MALLAIREAVETFLTDNYTPNTLSHPFYDREAVKELRENPIKTGAPYVLLEYGKTAEVRHGDGQDCYDLSGVLILHFFASMSLSLAERLTRAEAIYRTFPSCGRLPNDTRFIVDSRTVPTSLDGYSLGLNGDIIDHAFSIEYTFQGA